MSSVDKEYYEYLMAQDKSILVEKAMNLEMSLNEAKDTADAFYKELKVYKRALELACVDVGTISIITKILKDNQVRATSEDVINYYLDKAKKEEETLK